jgi:hypothetical protein
MTTVAISQLPEATTTSGTDVYPLVQSSITKKITFTNLFTNATGIPIVAGTTGTLSVARGGTGATAATGTGNVVLATSPTLTTPTFVSPTLGAALATSLNNVAITTPGSPATFTLGSGKTFAVNHSLTLAGTDATTMTFPATNATIARTDAAQTFTGTQTFSGPTVGTAQALSGAGAVNITQMITKFTSTATGNALTLADGVEGQIKIIVYVAEAAGADTGILTPTNLGAGTTITFTSVGNACVLRFLNTDWWVVSNYGCTVA